MAAHKLKAPAVRGATAPGLYSDGGGLYLQVTSETARSWIYEFVLRGRRRRMGLGSAADDGIALVDARDLAAAARRLRRQGIDPIEHRDAQRRAAVLEAARALTFRDAAQQFIASQRSAWSNTKHAAQWTATLDRYAFPVIGKLTVQQIDTATVMKVLEPIWSTKRETASRVRGRIESVLSWASARGFREGENPARWRGHLDQLLPERSRAQAVRHHSALSFSQVGAFLARLRELGSISARGLEFTILTAARTGEVLGATWNEIDFGAAVWTIPAARMKAGKEHRVPLSARALEILADMRERASEPEGFVFPGARQGRPLSNMALAMALRGLGRDETVHGFRSTFRDWCAERTSYPGEVAEMALAHTIGDKVEAAYRRGDLFEKRRRLMAEWATFCASPAPTSGTVTAIRG